MGEAYAIYKLGIFYELGIHDQNGEPNKEVAKLYF